MATEKQQIRELKRQLREAKERIARLEKDLGKTNDELFEFREFRRTINSFIDRD